jgi:hypothetical protein
MRPKLDRFAVVVLADTVSENPEERFMLLGPRLQAGRFCIELNNSESPTSSAAWARCSV